MSQPVIERVVTAGAELGECPVWSAAESRLYWVDVEGRRVHRFDPSTGLDESWVTPGRPGALACTPRSGRLLLAQEHQLHWFDCSTGMSEAWVDLEAAGTGNRLNDGRCDPVGRLWVGSMFSPASRQVASGLLHRVEPDGTSSVVQRDMGVPNGLAFAPDGRTMYLADSPVRQIWAADYDIESGRASRQRPFFAFEGIAGKPDGAAVDASGCYWIACVYGGAVIRITPEGRLDRQVELPVARPTMCAFGGDALDVLYVTSIGMDAKEHADDTNTAGDVFAFDPDVSGLPEPTFAV